MIKLKGELVNQYISKNTKTETFVYEVSGKAEELEQFKETQGEYYREDEVSGKPLFFTTTYAGEHTAITQTHSGGFRADTGVFLKLRSIEKQSTSLGHLAAQKVMDTQFADFGKSASVVTRKVAETEGLGEI